MRLPTSRSAPRMCRCCAPPATVAACTERGAGGGCGRMHDAHAPALPALCRPALARRAGLAASMALCQLWLGCAACRAVAARAGAARAAGYGATVARGYGHGARVKVTAPLARSKRPWNPDRRQLRSATELEVQKVVVQRAIHAAQPLGHEPPPPSRRDSPASRRLRSRCYSSGCRVKVTAAARRSKEARNLWRSQSCRAMMVAVQ